MRPVDTATKLRFPILFGGILALFFVGFKYRQSFMSDLEEKRAELRREDLESKKLIESKIYESRKIMFDKMKS